MPTKRKKSNSMAADKKSPKDFVRIELSAEEMISEQFPPNEGVRLEIIPLWSSGGKTFYRLKYWKYSTAGITITRREVASRFVEADRVDGEHRIVDKTSNL